MVKTTTSRLDEICVSNQKPRAHRRINGLQLPLHPQQILGWITIVITTVVNFVIVIPAQSEPFQDYARIVLVLLYALHAAAHAAALLLDPAEKQLRQLDRFAVPEFDRALHAHVIEDGRCHLCNIQTTNRNTKHCSICNKCVAHFDHHCKWLNHCIGKRNYTPFFASVTTATIISFLTALICFVDIAFYFSNPQLLSNYQILNATNANSSDTQEGLTDWSFLAASSTFGFVNLVICCVLLHLYSFHIYIAFLGVSTYEYIMRNVDGNDADRSTEKTSMCNFDSTCARINNSKSQGRLIQFLKKRNRWHKNKVGNTINTVSNDVCVENQVVELNSNTLVNEIVQKSTQTEPVTNLMAVIINRVNNRNNSILFNHKKQLNTNVGNEITRNVVSDFPTNLQN